MLKNKNNTIKRIMIILNANNVLYLNFNQILVRLSYVTLRDRLDYLG